MKKDKWRQTGELPDKQFERCSDRQTDSARDRKDKNH